MVPLNFKLVREYVPPVDGVWDYVLKETFMLFTVTIYKLCPR
jgi:hypothetical protein